MSRPNLVTVIRDGKEHGKAALNTIMDFDHVIRVDNDGKVHDDVKGVWAPDVTHEYPYGDGIEISGDEGWSLMDGYSGQDRYSGPIMHASEFIGGRMESDILANPGYYATVIVYTQEDDTDHNVSGWAVAHHEGFGNRKVVSVWSAFGHHFLSTDSEENYSCLICGAMYSLIADPDDPTSGRYVNVRGDDADACTAKTNLAHGYKGERHCESCRGDRSEPCEHESHECGCLLCDS